jgi:AcrR family transcriptional regulator
MAAPKSPRRPLVPASEGSGAPFPNYAALLEQRLAADPPKRKGERTRARLKASAVKVLDQTGYRDMRVSDICDAAGIGLATFYLYFQNKAEITNEVLVDFLEDLGASRAPPVAGTGLFESMVTINGHIMRAFEANAGLMRCLLQYSDEAPEFVQLWQARGHHWYQRVAHRMAAATHEGETADEWRMLLATYALGGMMDQIFRDLYVHQNRFLADVIRHVAPDTDALARELSLIWYRGAFGRDPE